MRPRTHKIAGLKSCATTATRLESCATTAIDPFARVRAAGLALPDVEAATKYDGSPVLKMRGCFMAGLARDPSAEAGTLVVRCDLEDREYLLQDAPETYYITDYHQKYPVVLVRLARIDDDALRDLLSASWQLTREKATKRRTHERAASL